MRGMCVCGGGGGVSASLDSAFWAGTLLSSAFAISLSIVAVCWALADCSVNLTSVFFTDSYGN